MEILVHNISHYDMVLELTWFRADERLVTLGRPKFSRFLHTSQKIHSAIDDVGDHDEHDDDHEDHEDDEDHKDDDHDDHDDGKNSMIRRNSSAPVTAPVHEREMDHPGYAFKAHCSETSYPVGFRLDSHPIRIDDIQHFRLKNNARWSEAWMASLIQHKKKTSCSSCSSCSSSSAACSSSSTSASASASTSAAAPPCCSSSSHELELDIYITGVYFPLIASLIPKWYGVLRQHASDQNQKLLYLISGAGIPRNTSHSSTGNSTEQLAKLIIRFARQYYSPIQVTQVHSGSDIYRYDGNVAFVNQELRPLLESNRQTIVHKCGDQWKKHFHVTMAYAAGTPARLSAVNACLRLYRPSYLHIWQLKTFWHEGKISLDDLDFQSFENLEASPAMPLQQIRDPLLKLLVDEMRVFRDQFIHSARTRPSELSSFWLRKTRKPVLAILVVQKSPDAVPVVHRGVNCEVYVV